MILIVLMAGFLGTAIAQEHTGPSQLEISATGIAEMYKKELNLNKEQYADVKQTYIKFLTYQAYNPGNRWIGCDKLEKNMQKILSEEQFKKWREIDPNRPQTEEEKAAEKEQKKKKK